MSLISLPFAICGPRWPGIGTHFAIGVAVVVAAALALKPMAATAAPVPTVRAENAPAGCTGPASGTWLRVIVQGVHSAKGLIAITLYPDEASRFLIHNGSLYVTRVPALAGTTDACIYVPRPGIYVVAIYHDANGNHQFDRSGLGLPAEAYGFSNNPTTLLGLPSFSSVRLNVSKSGLTSHIMLKYP